MPLPMPPDDMPIPQFAYDSLPAEVVWAADGKDWATEGTVITNLMTWVGEEREERGLEGDFFVDFPTSRAIEMLDVPAARLRELFPLHASGTLIFARNGILTSTGMERVLVRVAGHSPGDSHGQATLTVSFDLLSAVEPCDPPFGRTK